MIRVNIPGWRTLEAQPDPLGDVRAYPCAFRERLIMNCSLVRE